LIWRPFVLDHAAARAAFDAYAQEHRRHAPTGYRLEVLPHLTRLLPLDPAAPAYVMFARLPAASAESLIHAEIAHFDTIGRSFEWKWHALDAPADLPDRLAECGFVADEPEALLVMRTDAGAARALAAAAPTAPVAIRRVGVDIGVAQGVRTAVELQERIWGRRFDWLEAELSAAFADPATAFELVLAHAGAEVIGCGTLVGPAGARSANLHAGALLPEWRGRGLYSALLGARLRTALAWGVDAVHVDAAPMSRPILERKGFEFICETVPFQRPPGASSGSRSDPDSSP
jgi:GNAT superfamily N-acetyltransferase